MDKTSLRAEAVSRLSHNPDFKIFTEIIQEKLDNAITYRNIESEDKALSALSFIVGLKTVLRLEQEYKDILKKLQGKGNN